MLHFFTAIRAVRDMVKAPDFDRKMLLLATRISHGAGMETVLVSVLDSLLKTLKNENSGETVVEAITIIRCLIRLLLKLLGEPAANRYAPTFFSGFNCLTFMKTDFD
jgi:hypothetical protein